MVKRQTSESLMLKVFFEKIDYLTIMISQYSYFCYFDNLKKRKQTKCYFKNQNSL